jgi:monofunctional glycosyltransferase
MEDRAETPQELRLDPHTVRSEPVTSGQAGSPGSRPGARIEPVFRSEDRAPPALTMPTAGGFLPAGAGLLPVGLLPGAPAFGGPEPRIEPVFRHPENLPPGEPSRPHLVPASPARPDTASVLSFLRKAVRLVAFVAAGWALLTAALVVVYRFVDPPFSALMLQRKLIGEPVVKSWVPIEAISPSLVRTVIASEDGRFCQHSGIDLGAMQTALERAGDGTPRGASTISMQVAKNLFLWPSKSYLRKALEVPLTLAIEALWPKRRIMEIYLNIAEWGPGIYGAEAASRHHFEKPARALRDREAALLAVTLPNPILRDAGNPGPGTRRLASLIQARASGVSQGQISCVLRPATRVQTRGEAAWRPEIRRESGF